MYFSEIGLCFLSALIHFLFLNETFEQIPGWCLLEPTRYFLVNNYFIVLLKNLVSSSFLFLSSPTYLLLLSLYILRQNSTEQMH